MLHTKFMIVTEKVKTDYGDFFRSDLWIGQTLVCQEYGRSQVRSMKLLMLKYAGTLEKENKEKASDIIGT